MRGQGWIQQSLQDLHRRLTTTPDADRWKTSGSVRTARPKRRRGEPTRAVKPSVRETFPGLRDRLLASRPVIGHTVVKRRVHGELTFETGKPIYGKPTFRNVIDKNGRHV